MSVLDDKQNKRSHDHLIILYDYFSNLGPRRYTFSTHSCDNARSPHIRDTLLTHLSPGRGPAPPNHKSFTPLAFPPGVDIPGDRWGVG